MLEFNSARKRMSVIVKDEEGKILLLCKGADRLVKLQLNKHHKLLQLIADFVYVSFFYMAFMQCDV